MMPTGFAIGSDGVIEEVVVVPEVGILRIVPVEY
jgi:hypothetical protein